MLWTPSEAASVCYQDQPVPAKLECNGSDSNSADFSRGCTYSAARIDRVAVACPSGWFNISGTPAASQSQFCSSMKLQSANYGGEVCASGESRPGAGLRVGSISYKFGTWTSGSDRWSHRTNEGGTSVVAHTANGQTLHYCYKSGQKHDWDSTDLVVAYYCD